MANLLWCIWKHRWKAIKEGMVLDPQRTVNEALRLSQNDETSDLEASHLSINDNQLGSVDNHVLLEGMVKINVDGGIREGVGAAVCILRDEEGRFVSGHSGIEPSSCVAYMEALAIRMGLQEAQRLGFTKVLVLSDALGIVQAIMDGLNNTHLLKEFEVGNLQFIRRDHNEIADLLVQDTLNCNTAKSWDIFPDCIQMFVTQI